MRKIDVLNTRAADKNTIREINEKLILNVIREQQPISRVRLAERTGLQPSTVTIITARLIDEGWVREGENTASEPGRRPQNLYLNADKFRVLGVDVSRRETTLALADPNGWILKKWRMRTLLEERVFFRRLADKIAACLKEWRQESGIPVLWFWD